MKTTLTFALLLLASALRGVSAEPPAPAAPASVQEFGALEQFLCLNDAELDQLQRAITRVRALTPAEREKLRREIAHYRGLPADQRQHLRQGWSWSSAEQQNQWREMMQELPPARRAEIQAKLQSLPPEDKAAYRREMLEEHARTTHPAKP